MREILVENGPIREGNLTYLKITSLDGFLKGDISKSLELLYMILLLIVGF